MKKKHLPFIFGAIFLGMLVSSCSPKENNPTAPSIPYIDNNETKSTDRAIDALSNRVEITKEFSITTKNGTYTQMVDTNGTKVYTITESGLYEMEGLLENGQIIISGKDIDVEIEMNGLKITNSYNSPIFAKEAYALKIRAMEDSYNEILDLRSAKTKDTEELGEAAIYSKTDLKISGRGSLYVSGGYNNAIATTDDLIIKNTILKAISRNNTIKGNDSIAIESGQIIAISTAGDGIKTDNSDISGKQNQHGSISIIGGIVEVYSNYDGIEAAYDINIEKGTTILINSGSYSSYSGTIENILSDLYIKSPLKGYRFSAYFYNDDINNGIFVDGEELNISSKETYYKVNIPKGYTNLKCFFFENGKDNSLEEYYASSDGQTINSSKDLIDMKSIKNKEISYDWANFSFSNQGNDKEDNSSKGMKASNTITINGGTITICASDDCIHADSDTVIESTSAKGLGNVTVNGGFLDLVSLDDGIHGDHIVNINGGEIDILNAYEGIEGNILNFMNGKVKISASDDGLNASSGIDVPSINVFGGEIDITVGLGDTDGIDSNGNYYQEGGYVISRCRANGNGLLMLPLDVSGSTKILGGTFIGLGNVNSIKLENKNPLMTIKKDIPSGNYSISDTNISFTLKEDYQGLYITSDLITLGKSYTLSNGDMNYLLEIEENK